MSQLHPPQPDAPPTDSTGRHVLPAFLAILFLCIVLSQAYVKLLWGDEFVTFWIGQQHGTTGIWRALASGADPNPPLMHLFNAWSTSLFGSTSIAIRLPSILGMVLALSCLWLYLSRRLAPIYAATACLALMTTRGFDYAYDARSYSLLLGFAMAALLCWSRSLDPRGQRPLLWLLGMTAALSAGLSSNYYGTLAFLPVAAGEVCFSLVTGRKRPLTWLAITIAASPLLFYRELIRLNVAEFGPHAWNKPQLSMISDSYLVIVEGILWPILGLSVYALWRRRQPAAPALPPVFPTWDRAAIGVLIAYPVLAFLIALGGAGMVSPRCAIPVCLGVIIGGTAVFARYVPGRAIAFVLAFLCVWVLAREAACGYVLIHQRHAFIRFIGQVERATAPGEPVAVGDSLVLMPLYWYGAPWLRQQIVFPVDFDAIHRSGADDSGEQNLWGGRHGVFPVPIATPSELLQGTQERILIAPPKGWLAANMADRGYDLHEAPSNVPWDRLGGVFTPLAHEETRILIATPKSPQ